MALSRFARRSAPLLAATLLALTPGCKVSVGDGESAGQAGASGQAGSGGGGGQAGQGGGGQGGAGQGGAGQGGAGQAGQGGAGEAGASGQAGSSPEEATREALAKILDGDPRTAQTSPLSPDDYEDIAGKLAQAPGVVAVDYVGDTLGTFNVKVQSGGVLTWRHIPDDLLTEAQSLPAEADLSGLSNPDWTDGWKPPVSSPAGVPAPPGAPSANSYATHFPVASSDPDPDYAKDDTITCPSEGKVAIVDFLWTEAHEQTVLYTEQWMVDGVMLWDKVTRMAKAAGFEVDHYKDNDINAGNFSKLADYTIVIMIGHGGRPGPKTTARIGKAVSTILTADTYAPNKYLDGGLSYQQGFEKGYITYNIKTKLVSWTSLLFKDLYKPQKNQLWMPNQCWSMLPYNVGLDHGENGGWAWSSGVTGRVFNIGDGLMASGVKSVFGYITPATPEAVTQNTLPFFRRLFGGYYAKDKPPAPHTYWPTCMSAQTFFRLPATPQLAVYANKWRASSLYTMYAVKDPQYLREVCTPKPNAHASMVSFMLTAGTPATALPLCWDQYWSHGDYPSGIVDPLCSQGDNPTEQEATFDAACTVKVARKVTNAMLAP